MFNCKIGCVLVAALLLCSCAQVAPPVPPSLELPKPVTDLKAVRKGGKVFLRWTMPAQTTDGETVNGVGVTRICRSFDRATSQCEKAGEVAAAFIRKPPSANGASREENYTDVLPDELQGDPGQILSYSVSVENESGRSAGLSNRVEVPAAATWPAPSDFKAQLTADGVVLSWAAISPAASFHGIYRIYRQAEGSSGVVAGELPLDPVSTRFVDRGFEWGKTYYYQVTMVTEISGGMHPCGTAQTPQPDCATVYRIEGDDSPAVRIFADDVFPPAVPSGVQAVFSGEGQKPFVDLLWAPDTETDLAGYNVYRHEQGSAPVKINSEPVKPPAYRDFAVQPGTQYFYSIAAVDVRQNESSRSEEASERVP